MSMEPQQQFSHISKEKKWSPHGGRCLEDKADIVSHCATCQLWLCEDCAKIDHTGPSCMLIPQHETLLQMMQSSRTDAQNTCRSLQHFKREIVTYQEQLQSCKAIMESALDCIKKEEKRLEKVAEESTEAEANIRKIVEDKTHTDLPESLSVLQSLGMAMSQSQKWVKGVLSTLLDDKTHKLSKELLVTTVQLHLASAENRACREVLALHTINSSPVCSKIKTDGVRLFIHSLEYMTPPSGARGLQLDCVKKCMDKTSTLTFLDLTWGKSASGRVFIRLLGQISRAQNFLKMCTGENGPSFRGTRFHRMWWKGQPGEHIWAGDYDKGDGSGGILPSDLSEDNEKYPESCHKLPITAGLVAGTYVKQCNSSIFRIYTKESKDTMEDAAFGRVEFGLQVLDAAIKHNKITDITISDCGIIIEP
ncbi:hypothetical protein Pcinc_035459 [Petrolisthes cinctipes]|uniref:PPIase cyclophilin-type domain-containing protein n=1 Tax=Petrolisthes cinctipes TaxID=88211 RepID=A0AAE1BXR9_PETCI|nr:hypothetical protein Pcinc_035459 [Petrolisthes cinctipes]